MHFFDRASSYTEDGSERKRRKKERAKAKREGRDPPVTVDETRGDGAVAWAPYTDHDPVEIGIGFELQWRKPEEKPRVITPDFARLLGNSEEAEESKRKLGEQLNTAMEGRDELTWEEVCALSMEESLRVLGESPDHTQGRGCEAKKLRKTNWMRKSIGYRRRTAGL